MTNMDEFVAANFSGANEFTRRPVRDKISLSIRQIL
jgi:hypothetical protein